MSVDECLEMRTNTPPGPKAVDDGMSCKCLETPTPCISKTDTELRPVFVVDSNAKMAIVVRINPNAESGAART